MRPILTIVVVLLAYFLLPLDGVHYRSGLILLIVGLAAVCAVWAWQIYKVLHAAFPVIQAIEALVATISVYLVGYAAWYYLLSQADPSGFNEPLTRVDALYFCLTVFATVGFGDIVATTDATRVVTSVQIVANLTLIALGARFLAAAVKWRKQKQNETA